MFEIQQNSAIIIVCTSEFIKPERSKVLAWRWRDEKAVRQKEEGVLREKLALLLRDFDLWACQLNDHSESVCAFFIYRRTLW